MKKKTKKRNKKKLRKIRKKIKKIKRFRLKKKTKKSRKFKRRKKTKKYKIKVQLNKKISSLPKIKSIMNDNGICLLHTIGSVDRPGPGQPFIQKYIFPGGIVPSLSDIIEPIEKTGLIVSDTETLIRHYDKTLESWLERFLAKRNEVKDLFDEKFVKMWEFYLASCAAAFRYRDLAVFQLQIVKNFQSAHRTRDYIYS